MPSRAPCARLGARGLLPSAVSVSMNEAPSDRPRIARGFLPFGGAALLSIAAAVFLASIVLSASGSTLPRRTLPAPVLFFVQLACLFPNAAIFQIEWRAEAYSCDEGAFVPLDVRPYFPVHAEDKENRFARAMHFHRRDPNVMRALETYVLESAERDGQGYFGGVRFSSLRIPLPEPGAVVERHRYVEIAEVPESRRKEWYTTPATDRQTRCVKAAR